MQKKSNGEEKKGNIGAGFFTKSVIITEKYRRLVMVLKPGGRIVFLKSVLIKGYIRSSSRLWKLGMYSGERGGGNNEMGAFD